MNKIVALFLLCVALVAAAPLLRVKEPNANQYIVVFHDNVTASYIDSHIVRLLSANQNSSSLLYRYNYVLNGYAIKIAESALPLSDPNVKYIEEDGTMHATQCTSQNGATWGIARVSQAAPSNPSGTTFTYPSNAGSGIISYIIDTGVYIAHSEFSTGRAVFAFQASGTGSTDDKNGHGTHVAGTVAGTTYGVAKRASIRAVKVLGDNGSGTNAGVISGIDFAAGNCGNQKCTANMSLGGGYSAATNDATNKLANAGVVIVVAAGNDNADAGSYSPASAANAVTVGSTAQGAKDSRSSFSNYGSYVDVFAPGSSITSAWIGSTGATNTISGTSMASPHVCGVATVLYSNGYTSSNIKSTIISNAKTGIIDLLCSSAKNAAQCNQSPNRFVYLNGC